MKVLSPILLIAVFLSACSSFMSESISEDRNLILKERIDGSADIMDNVNGSVLFSLKDNTPVECVNSLRGWFEVGAFVVVTEEEKKNYKISRGSDLIDLSGSPIGLALDDVNISMVRRDSGRYLALISGFVPKENIKKHTIPEVALTEILRNKDEIFKKDLKQFIQDYNFVQNPNNDNEYFITESVLKDPLPQERITLLFLKDKLQGVVHSRELPMKTYKTCDLVRDYMFTPAAMLSDEDLRGILHKKTLYYSSID